MKESSPQRRFSILNDDLRVTLEDALKSDLRLRIRLCGLKTAVPGLPAFDGAASRLFDKWNAWLVAAWGSGEQEGVGDQMPKQKTRSRKGRDQDDEAVDIIEIGSEEAESSARPLSLKRRKKVVASPSKVATPSPAKSTAVATASPSKPIKPVPAPPSTKPHSGGDQSLHTQLLLANSRNQFLEQECRRLQHVEAEVATLRCQLAAVHATEELVKELRHQLDIRDRMIEWMLGSPPGGPKS